MSLPVILVTGGCFAANERRFAVTLKSEKSDYAKCFNEMDIAHPVDFNSLLLLRSGARDSTRHGLGVANAARLKQPDDGGALDCGYAATIINSRAFVNALAITNSAAFPNNVVTN